MDITVVFPGNKKVDAIVGPHTVRTDQPAASGGDGTAVSPFELFLASLATCAGIYVLGFLENRGLSTDGVKVVQHHEFDRATGMATNIELEIILPPSIPEKYHEAIIRAASLCKVKKTIQAPPAIDVKITTAA